MAENVFSQIKAQNKPKRGKGLSSPPKPEESGKNISIPEHTPAVAVKAPARSYRIGTYLTEEAGELFEKLHSKIRRSEGRKVKQAEIIERALIELEKSLER